MSTPERITNGNVIMTLGATQWDKVRRALIVAAAAKAAQMNTDLSTAIMIGPSTNKALCEEILQLIDIADEIGIAVDETGKTDGRQEGCGMSESFIESVKRASVDFSRSTKLVAKYVIVGRDYVDSLRAFLDDIDRPWKCDGERLPERPQVMNVLNIKIFVAPWTTGLTILPDVATCDTFACVTTYQKP